MVDDKKKRPLIPYTKRTHISYNIDSLENTLIWNVSMTIEVARKPNSTYLSSILRMVAKDKVD